VSVVPLDAVPSARILVENRSHGPVTRGTLGRLRLRLDPISRLEGHAVSFPLVSPVICASLPLPDNLGHPFALGRHFRSRYDASPPCVPACRFVLTVHSARSSSPRPSAVGLDGGCRAPVDARVPSVRSRMPAASLHARRTFGPEVLPTASTTAGTASRRSCRLPRDQTPSRCFAFPAARRRLGRYVPAYRPASRATCGSVRPWASSQSSPSPGARQTDATPLRHGLCDSFGGRPRCCFRDEKPSERDPFDTGCPFVSPPG